MKKYYIIGFVFGGFLVSTAAFGQDIIGMQDQIDALKEEMIILNRKIYRDNADSAVSVTSSGAGSLSEYDEIIRNLNGKIEELEYKIKQTDERIATISKDMETRFNMLEGKPIAAGTASLSEQKKYAASVANGAPKSIVGDAIQTGSLKYLDGDVEKADSLYKKGLEALKVGDTALAEQNFQLILNKYPSDKLAGNAQYWLGEVYYKDGDYKKAAVAFGKGYEKYKSGNKGADSLYKLGVTMSQMNNKSEACAAFKALPVEFPTSDAELKNKVKSQASKLGCK